MEMGSLIYLCSHSSYCHSTYQTQEDRWLAAQRGRRIDHIEATAASMLRTAIDGATVRVEAKCAATHRAAMRAARGAR